MCICEACHCSFELNELLNNLCNQCTETINLLELLGFIETKFNKNADYWIFTDDFNKFIPIVYEKNEPLSEIYQSIHCKEFLEIQETYIGWYQAELEELKERKLSVSDFAGFLFDYEKELIREIARVKWFDKYKELMPFSADSYQLFNNMGLKEMIEKDNQFLKSNNLI